MEQGLDFLGLTSNILKDLEELKQSIEDTEHITIIENFENDIKGILNSFPKKVFQFTKKQRKDYINKITQIESNFNNVIPTINKNPKSNILIHFKLEKISDNLKTCQLKAEKNL